MDAKTVQLILVGLVAVGLLLGLLDLAAALLQGRRPRNWRSQGTILTMLGALSFLVLAGVISQPQEGWQPSRPADVGWEWAWWIAPGVAGMLASWAVLGTLQPRHSASLLFTAATLIPALLIVAAIAGGTSSGPDEPSASMLLMVVLIAFSLPAAMSGFAFISQDGTHPKERPAAS